MSRYRSINVKLEQSELDALAKAAQNELRHPRDQARYYLLKSLGLVNKSPGEGKHNGAAQVCETGSGAGVNVQG